MDRIQNSFRDPSFLLRLGPALVMIFFGIDQFRNPMNWMSFMPNWAPRLTGINPVTIMRLHSIINIVLGVLLLTYRSSVISWASFLWFLSILPFAFMADWTIGLRDLALTLGLLALIYLI